MEIMQKEKMQHCTSMFLVDMLQLATLHLIMEQGFALSQELNPAQF